MYNGVPLLRTTVHFIPRFYIFYHCITNAGPSQLDLERISHSGPVTESPELHRLTSETRTYRKLVAATLV
jgi:hypothetical protein